MATELRERSLPSYGEELAEPGRSLPSLATEPRNVATELGTCKPEGVLLRGEAPTNKLVNGERRSLVRKYRERERRVPFLFFQTLSYEGVVLYL